MSKFEWYSLSYQLFSKVQFSVSKAILFENRCHLKNSNWNKKRTYELIWMKLDMHKIFIKSASKCSSFSFDGILFKNGWHLNVLNLNKKRMFINWFRQDSICTQFLLRSRHNSDDQLRSPSCFTNTFFEILNLKKTCI